MNSKRKNFQNIIIFKFTFRNAPFNWVSEWTLNFSMCFIKTKLHWTSKLEILKKDFKKRFTYILNRYINFNTSIHPNTSPKAVQRYKFIRWESEGRVKSLSLVPVESTSCVCLLLRRHSVSDLSRGGDRDHWQWHGSSPWCSASSWQQPAPTLTRTLPTLSDSSWRVTSDTTGQDIMLMIDDLSSDNECQRVTDTSNIYLNDHIVFLAMQSLKYDIQMLGRHWNWKRKH